MQVKCKSESNKQNKQQIQCRGYEKYKNKIPKKLAMQINRAGSSQVNKVISVDKVGNYARKHRLEVKFKNGWLESKATYD